MDSNPKEEEYGRDRVKILDIDIPEEYEATKEQAAKGYVKAVFATMDVVDRHNDVLLPGSIGKQYVDMFPYNHGNMGYFFTGSGRDDWPVGKGKVYEEDDKAIFEGNMFMDMETPSELYKLLKNMGRKQQYSMNLRKIKGVPGERDGKEVYLIKSFQIDEVSPVYRGAGVGTRTLALKALQQVAGVQGGGTELPEGYDSMIQKIETLETENANLKAEFNTMNQRLETLSELQSNLFTLIKTLKPNG